MCFMDAALAIQSLRLAKCWRSNFLVSTYLLNKHTRSWFFRSTLRYRSYFVLNVVSYLCFLWWYLVKFSVRRVAATVATVCMWRKVASTARNNLPIVPVCFLICFGWLDALKVEIRRVLLYWYNLCCLNGSPVCCQGLCEDTSTSTLVIVGCFYLKGVFKNKSSLEVPFEVIVSIAAESMWYLQLWRAMFWLSC